MDVDGFIEAIFEDPRAEVAFAQLEAKDLVSLIFEGQSSSDILDGFLEAIGADAEANGFSEAEIQKNNNQVVESANYVISEFWKRYGESLPIQQLGPNHCGGFNLNGKVVVVERKT